MGALRRKRVDLPGLRHGTTRYSFPTPALRGAPRGALLFYSIRQGHDRNNQSEIGRSANGQRGGGRRPWQGWRARRVRHVWLGRSFASGRLSGYLAPERGAGYRCGGRRTGVGVDCAQSFAEPSGACCARCALRNSSRGWAWKHGERLQSARSRDGRNRGTETLEA
jgi:hypothetical protein